MKGDLLETLSEQTGIFISSLRNQAVLPTLSRHLWEMRYEDYPLTQWGYCLSYLTGSLMTFDTYVQLAEFLDTLVAENK